MIKINRRTFLKAFGAAFVAALAGSKPPKIGDVSIPPKPVIAAIKKGETAAKESPPQLQSNNRGVILSIDHDDMNFASFADSVTVSSDFYPTGQYRGRSIDIENLRIPSDVDIGKLMGKKIDIQTVVPDGTTIISVGVLSSIDITNGGIVNIGIDGAECWVSEKTS